MKAVKPKQNVPRAAPTPGPWSIEEDEIVYRHWRYTGYPHFGRITVARLDSTWPSREQRQANLELIVTAVNACFTVAPATPIAAAKALTLLVNAAEDYLTRADDPNMPLEELKTRLRLALRAVKGGNP
jgi:hypothetical protein